VRVLARRSEQRLAPDPSRVITRLFVPGQEGFDHQESRVDAVLARLLALGEDDVQACLDDILTRFDTRHRDLRSTFLRHADEVADRLEPGAALSPGRRLLVGATFTSEYALEGAALCNPSIVASPDQAGVRTGSLRFVMSARAIGEGHRSSIELRTGVVNAKGHPTVDAASAFATTGSVLSTVFDAAILRAELDRLDGSSENADYVLGALGPSFTADELEEQLGNLERTPATRRHASRTAAFLRTLAGRSYGVTFDAATAVSERVLWPATPAECHGMEDARFVRFTDEDDTVRYYATYTAYDGADISQQLLETTDFRSFRSAPIIGRAAANKGLALFPRRISGRFAALSRWDRESNAITFSDDPHRWDEAVDCQVPTRAWEVLQLGNCGSPLETEAGWLVLTHGVGPMRTYAIGALLLDLDDPTRVIGSLPEPLLSPDADEQDGYVPNVVYSCGALIHADTLVLPYGISDGAIGVATVGVADLLDALQSDTPIVSRPKEHAMPDKSPQKPAGKKPSKTLKEKREAKRGKKEPRPGVIAGR
jgi:predicted GH43/DUF377 family glycosyl hydrolase